mmetsp:Transcript_69941/g.211606  ORF Transcript_69941/g.211606 Transcript_69941/m.211606 type:complete len:271 (+) Transcript_69941:528-1340(+)
MSTVKTIAMRVRMKISTGNASAARKNASSSRWNFSKRRRVLSSLMIGTTVSRKPCAALSTSPSGSTKPLAALTTSGAAAARSIKLKVLKKKVRSSGQQPNLSRNSSVKRQSMTVSSTAAASPQSGAGFSTCKRVTRTVPKMKKGVTLAKTLAKALDSGISRKLQTLTLHERSERRERRYFTCSQSSVVLSRRARGEGWPPPLVSGVDLAWGPGHTATASSTMSSSTSSPIPELKLLQASEDLVMLGARRGVFDLSALCPCVSWLKPELYR